MPSAVSSVPSVRGAVQHTHISPMLRPPREKCCCCSWTRTVLIVGMPGREREPGSWTSGYAPES